MKTLFSDENREILVESDSRKVTFFAYQLTDIIPAMHFFDAHPDLAQKEIQVERTTQQLKTSEHPKKERYIPKLIPDFRDNTFAYQNYHFVLLRCNQAHRFEDVLRGYADFITEMRKPMPRKLKIKDADESAITWLKRIAEMKKLNMDDSAYWTERPCIAYAYYANSSKGLANHLGLDNERLKDSDLHRRIVF